MKTLEEMIAVMQAALEGKTIEYAHKMFLDWQLMIVGMSFNWQHYDYRVKQEESKQEYIPYESAEEFLQAQKEHGFYIQCDDCYNPFEKDEGELFYVIPTEIKDDDILFVNVNSKEDTHIMVSFKQLIEYVWTDGTPCGKLKQ